MDSIIIRWYRTPAFTIHKTKEILAKLKKVNNLIEDVKTEICYHVEFSQKNVDIKDKSTLEWILSPPLNPENLSILSHLREVAGKHVIIECGPRFNFSTSDSSNAVSICHSLGLKNVTRLEVSKRYLILWKDSKLTMTPQLEEDLASVLHDRMTECRYTEQNIPKRSFNEKLVKREDLHDVNVMQEGRKALEKINIEMGLAFDERDLDYYTYLFTQVMKRNPTTVECFDLAQSNSEHSRHWFFKGKMVIDGQEYEESLIDMIIKTQDTTNPNNVIKFSDNSSAIIGYKHESLRPVNAGYPSELKKQPADSHLIFTAETHNFPTGVAPFSGATTGTGGRIRDVEAVGRGGYCIAGTAGYSVGNLYIPNYNLPWEDETFEYPNNFASPVDILVEASNGASDYGNKFGEPLISGFARSFGLQIGSERREWIKPIMFSGGLGSMEANMVDKLKPEVGMKMVKIGGPVYRIGVGGGAASSVEVQGDNKAELDFNAVQRGDAEMEQKLNRVVRACLEMGEKNPIVSIHDQGAGGNGNVLKELVEPVGGVVYANRFDLGDPTINSLELWGAEYQESNALLCRKEDVELIKTICERERCPVNFVGEVTGTGRIVLTLDESMNKLPVNLDLEHVLGKMPRKVFNLERVSPKTQQLNLPKDLTVKQALERVLRLPSVASKRYLTNKVDRCVTGLIAQQQCVGPLHTPLADVAVTAISHFGYEGIATSIGEQPIKGLINNSAGARMTVGESLSNLVFAAISDLKDVKCSGNWMWAAKLPGEGAALYDACVAMCNLMSELGVAVDGGKDSLSMAARVGKETIKAPGTLVVSTYAPCPDVRKVVTPDLKQPANNKKGILLHVDLSNGENRLGGSALAQCYQQLGDNSPDVYNAKLLVNAFNATQKLIKEDKILSGHDISDGGLITCLLEMAFGGLCGLNINISHKAGNIFEILFAEEMGWVLEVDESELNYVQNIFKSFEVPVYNIGQSIGFGLYSPVIISVNKIVCLQNNILPLYKLWEETSYQLEFYQTMRDCVQSEFDSFNYRTGPKYNLTFDPDVARPLRNQNIKVAVLREEGTNGDREMAAAFARVGFEVWDITMQDLISGAMTVDRFRGLIFPGGFSYADVLGSAKGWAAGILFNSTVQNQFKSFLSRTNTFSLGVCNGCQLMGLMGWIGYRTITSQNDKPDVLLEHNLSERFECRWSTVKIDKSRAIMLQGMEGSSFGVWVAHGEGRFTFREESILKQLETDNCVSLRYVDDNGKPTEVYPMNPNGSVGGLAGICSKDGRHLAMMPHPERCDQMYLWPYAPKSWDKLKKSPWERMFQNAFEWCYDHE